MTATVTFGLLALGSLPPADFVALVKRAEAARFETFWAADERFFRDCWAQLAVATQHSDALRLGTAVTDPYNRHPALTAVSVATLNEFSGGRAIFGSTTRSSRVRRSHDCMSATSSETRSGESCIPLIPLTSGQLAR